MIQRDECTGFQLLPQDLERRAAAEEKAELRSGKDERERVEITAGKRKWATGRGRRNLTHYVNTSRLLQKGDLHWARETLGIESLLSILLYRSLPSCSDGDAYGRGFGVPHTPLHSTGNSGKHRVKSQLARAQPEYSFRSRLLLWAN